MKNGKEQQEMRVDAEEKKKVFLRSRGVGNISFGNSSSK
jgi:hypothetical protein